MIKSMGRLFWKIFIGFWLTLLVTGFIVGALVWQHNKERIEQLEILADNPRAEFSVSSMASILREQGRDSLQALYQQHKKRYRRPPPVYIVDAAGNELLGRSVSRLILDKAQAEIGKLDVDTPTQSAVQQVNSPNGEQFLLFIPRRGLRAVTPQQMQRFKSHERDSHRYFLGNPARILPRDLPFLPLLIVLVGSLIFSAIIAWYITRPIRYLREATNQFADGKLDTRVMHKLGNRKDEITDLAKDFDHMAEQVQQLIFTQKRLLNDVSHELRSPLARLQVAIEMARQQPEKTHELMQRIDKECQRLDELVGEVLTLSRLEANVQNNDADFFDINGLLESIVTDARFEAVSQNKHVLYKKEKETLLKGSIELLHRAFENIIRNAIFYTPENTQVVISTAFTLNHIMITICDAGNGIAEDKLAKIFHPFVRIKDDNQNVKIPGYGLGLAIARRAIEIHQGSVIAYNQPGAGLCIEVKLPL